MSYAGQTQQPPVQSEDPSFAASAEEGNPAASAVDGEGDGGEHAPLLPGDDEVAAPLGGFSGGGGEPTEENGGETGTPTSNFSSSARDDNTGRAGSMWTNFKKGAVTFFHIVKWIVLVIVFFVLLIWFSSWNADRTTRYSEKELQKIRELVVFAGKSATEAERVNDPLQALLHANYAVCYLNAARHQVDENTLEELTGARVTSLDHHFGHVQRKYIELLERRMQQAANAGLSSADGY